MNLTPHGKVANIPASEVEVIVEREPRAHPRPRPGGRARVLRSEARALDRVATEPGSSRFRIEDALTNHGAFDQEFQIIDHANCGPPLLGPARASQALGRVTPFNAHAAKDVATYAEYTAPARGFIEQVSNLRPFGDQYGRSLILLRNGSNANRDASRS
jgi:hypothetical protein